VLSTIVSVVNGQTWTGTSNGFASGEAQRLYDLLDGLGCIGNSNCVLGDFTPTSACNDISMRLRCNNAGRVSQLYAQLLFVVVGSLLTLLFNHSALGSQGLTGTIGSVFSTFRDLQRL
jgi:hypothetical protein